MSVNLSFTGAALCLTHAFVSAPYLFQRFVYFSCINFQLVYAKMQVLQFWVVFLGGTLGWFPLS